VNLHLDVSINYQLNRWLSAMTSQALTDVAEAAARVSNYDQFTGEFLALAGKLLGQGRRRDAAFCLPPGDERKTPTRTRFLRFPFSRPGYDWQARPGSGVFALDIYRCPVRDYLASQGEEESASSGHSARRCR